MEENKKAKVTKCWREWELCVLPWSCWSCALLDSCWAQSRRHLALLLACSHGETEKQPDIDKIKSIIIKPPETWQTKTKLIHVKKGQLHVFPIMFWAMNNISIFFLLDAEYDTCTADPLNYFKKSCSCTSFFPLIHSTSSTVIQSLCYCHSFVILGFNYFLKTRLSAWWVFPL